MAGSLGTRRVVDAPTRMFHALFALSFLGAYLSAESEHWRALHITLGYTMSGLLALRVLYGLLGPRHARLRLMWRKLGGMPAWLRALGTGLRQGRLASVPWRQGQNLLMALAVASLLALALPLTLSGYASYAEWGDALGGPLRGDFLEDLHEFFGELMLGAVLVHLALLVGLSLVRRRNQALPMLSGRVEGNGPDLVPHNRRWMAALLLGAVLAFGAWQWRPLAQGLLPGEPGPVGKMERTGQTGQGRAGEAIGSGGEKEGRSRHRPGADRHSDLRSRRPA
ncbi:MAG: cytochrome b/b6 domain-containing protein [Burkholderiales bacterium]|nr:cytochrome b/b6 domain-containing protein [Burkholderiales bacterium]